MDVFEGEILLSMVTVLCGRLQSYFLMVLPLLGGRLVLPKNCAHQPQRTVTTHRGRLLNLNEHKFVQKDAKNNILLIYFEFSSSIIGSVHWTGVYKKIRLNGIKWGKFCQTGKNGVKLGKICQTEFIRLNRAKHGQTGPNSAKLGQAVPIWVTILGLVWEWRASLGWRLTLLGMVGDHPWQLSPGVSLISNK